MTAACEPLPKSVAEELLQVVAQSICDRPGESAAQRDSRTRQMVHSTMGMQPRDGLEYMLSTMLVGHFHLILHSMREVFRGQTDTQTARTKSTIVALDRAMIGMIKEFRVQRTRPLANWTVEVPVVASEETASPLSDPAAFVAEMAEREKPDAEPEKADGLERVVPVQTQRRGENMDKVRTHAIAAVEADDMSPEVDDVLNYENLAAFEKMLGAVTENLEELRALDVASGAAASGA
jgi:hypothetical protein